MSSSQNTQAMMNSPRCGAKTRRGTPCRAPAVYGRQRCRMHGGADGSGAPAGNKNAVTKGFYTKEKVQEREEYRKELDQKLDALEKIKVQMLGK